MSGNATADEGQLEQRNSRGPSTEHRQPQKSPPKQQVEPKSDKKPEPRAAQTDDDDPEEDFDGEKVRRSEIYERARRAKEIERASHERFRKSSDATKQLEARERALDEATKRLQQDPWAVQRAMGWTDEQITQAAEQELIKRVKRAQMTPEQIEAEQTRIELDRLRQENQSIKQKQQQEQHAQLKQRYIEHWDQTIGQAMEAGHLARTSATAKKVAHVIGEYLRAGEKIDPVVAAQIVRDNHHNEIRHEFTELRDQLKDGRITHEKYVSYVADLVGTDTVKLIQQAAVKKAQDFEPQKPAASRQPSAPPKRTFDSFEEANAWIDKQHKRG